MADLIRDAEQPRVATGHGIGQALAESFPEPVFAVPAGIVLTGRVLPVVDDPAPLAAAVERDLEPPTLQTVESAWPEHDAAGKEPGVARN